MSINVSKQHREELLDKIKQIRNYIAKAPQDANTGNLLQYLDEITKDVKGKKYGLVFEQHREQIDETLETHLPVLTERKDLFIDNGDKMNFLIEGDNLAALKLLEKTHKGKIDVIYIDPPYNTGSDDFQYDDNYVNKDDLYVHSKWISFMESRLKKAACLLKDSGCILISINENEVFGLKLLCDDIFGNDNYLTTFAVKVRHENRILKGDKDFHEVFEYLLFYRKSSKHKTSKRIFDNTSNEKYIWTIEELDSPTEIIQMGNKNVSVFSPKQYSLKKAKPSEKNFKKISIRGSIKEGNSSGRFFMAHLSQFIGKKPGYVYKVENMGDDGYGYRYFIIPDKTNRKNGDYLQGVPQFRTETKDVPYANLLDFEQAFNNVGYEGDIEFRNGKKPIVFLQHCFDMSGLSHGSKFVLDFFAGSGSTGHALLKYNEMKKCNHKFILCTNNENNICRDITYERLKTVITGKRKDDSDYNEHYTASLKYYKIDFVPISDKLYYEYADLLLLHIRELVELENGINFNGNNEIAIVLTDEEMEQFVAQPQNKVKVLYRGHNVLLTDEQEDYLRNNGIQVNVIPDYYYNELNK